jgi:hypothetical protein
MTFCKNKVNSALVKSWAGSWPMFGFWRAESPWQSRSSRILIFRMYLMVHLCRMVHTNKKRYYELVTLCRGATLAVPEADPIILHIDPANTLVQTGTGLAIFVRVRAFLQPCTDSCSKCRMTSALGTIPKVPGWFLHACICKILFGHFCVLQYLDFLLMM